MDRSFVLFPDGVVGGSLAARFEVAGASVVLRPALGVGVMRSFQSMPSGGLRGDAQSTGPAVGVGQRFGLSVAAGIAILGEDEDGEVRQDLSGAADLPVLCRGRRAGG